MSERARKGIVFKVWLLSEKREGWSNFAVMDTSFGCKLGVNGTANFAEADFVK
jgi:hypothetical protein